MGLYKFTITPKTCGVCHRRFIFEHYQPSVKYIFTNGACIDLQVCKKCIDSHNYKRKQDQLFTETF